MFIFSMTVLLLVAMGIALFHLDRESLWYDEGFTAFILHDDAPVPDGLRETARYLLDSAVNVFQRARDDVHPLLYYGIMDGWTLIMGESVWMLRLPSVIFGLIAVSATFALGRELFDKQVGLISALLLGVSHFFIYYTREARMYTLLLALVILATWAYLRWLNNPTWRRGIVYGVLIGLLMHTHYISAFIIGSQVLYLVYCAVFRRKFAGIRRTLIPFVTGLIVFLPWLPFAIRQLTGHPDGPLGQALAPAEWGTITWLWDIITSSHGGLYLIAFLLGSGLIVIRRNRKLQDKLVLLLLWLIVLPAGLLIINGSGRAVIVVRYVLVCVPPLLIFSAFGIRHLTTTPSLIQRLNIRYLPVIVTLALVAWIAYTQLTTYSFYWGEKPRWDEALQQVAQTRESDEPALIDLVPHNVASYYARQYEFVRGISIDIGWNDFVPEHIQDFVSRFDKAESVWAILPSDSSKTWYAIPSLLEGRAIGYRDSVQNMLLYRFDQADTSGTLHLSYYAEGFGELLSYQSQIGHHYFAETGKPFCFPVELEALQDVPSQWSLLASLTQGYSTTRADATLELPALSAGNTFNDDICIPIPADAPRGPYLLRLALRHTSGKHEPIVESDTGLLWGYFVGVAWVSVDG